MWHCDTISLAHRLIYHFYKIGYNRYKYSLSRVESVQRNKLKKLLQASIVTKYCINHNISPNLSWENFKQRIPITEYSDYESLVIAQREHGGLLVSPEPCDRYQPTSGSSSQMKWIPYTTRFLSELDQAIAPLIVDILAREKRLFYGKHYWSLSWIPTELRKLVNTNANDDLALIPPWKRIFMSMTMAVPNSISYAASCEGSIFATLVYLAATRNLSLISVWSPTFALNLFERMKKERLELATILKTGKWGRFEAELSFVPCPRSEETASILHRWDGQVSSIFLSELWPDLAMISSWDTSSSSLWAKDLKRLFPKATFLGKGLWATEGVVTIPFDGKYPLAVNSHFYEFKDLDTDKVYPAWGLKLGQVVTPLLTTGSGFLRYALPDRLKVIDFIDDCPCFIFLGRKGGVDLVGEKLSPEIAIDIIKQVSNRFNVRALSLFGVTREGSDFEKPGYILLCEGDHTAHAEEAIGNYTEKILLESFHYKLARDIGQLSSSRAYIRTNARALYIRRAEIKGMVLGDIKIEPLVSCRYEELLEVFDNTKQQSLNLGYSDNTIH